MSTRIANLLSRLHASCRWIVGPAARWVCGLVLLGTGVATAGWLTSTLHDHVHQPIEEVTIRFIDSPAWIGDSLHDHLASTAAPWLLGTRLHHNDLVQTRMALLDSGCFSSVRQVRRVGPSIVEIEADFLRPRATIIDADGPLLIDATGQVLPSGFHVQTDSTLISIRNPAYDRPTEGRGHWPGADVSAALSVLDLLGQQDWAGQITAVDLSNYERRGELVLVTDTQSRIVWGSAPGEEAALEALADKKIERLAWLHAHHGRIDQHHRGVIDVTDSSVVTKR
jgi:hypothetical protein